MAKSLQRPAPATLLNRCVASSPRLKKSAPFIFALIPNSRELCLRYAAYVGDLRGPGGELVLLKSLESAFSAVEALGVTPFTVDAHKRGFSVLVCNLLRPSCDLLAIEVCAVDRPSWSPFEGPYIEWCAHLAAPVTVQPRQHSAAQPFLEHILRVCIAARILGMSDLARVGHHWDDITGQALC